MLNFVNEELFSYGARTETNRNDEEFTQLVVGTSNYLVGYAKGSKSDKFHNPQPDQKIDKKHDIDMRDNPDLERIYREILTINYINQDQIQDHSLLSKQSTSLKVNDNTRGIPQVSIRCLREDAPNKSDIYVVAFPFNGMLTAIPDSPQFRIYKGMIVSSVRPFYFFNRRYRKILYLVVEPHRALFAPDHKYHTDEINLKLESYAIYNDRTTKEEKTNHEIFTVTMRDGSWDSEWEYEVLNEAKKIESDPTKPLWSTFRFAQKERYPRHDGDRPYTPRDNQKDFDSSKPGKVRNGRKPGYVEGGNYITTNKNGIRKEVPMGRSNQSYGRRYNDNGGDNLDSMMRQSGMFDDQDGRNNRRGGRNNSKGKRNNRRNNYDD